MKILKRIIIWLLAIVLLLVAVAYLLPSSYKVERSTLIKGDGDMIFSMVCDFHNWDHWTPWSSEMDTTATEEIIGNCEVGAVQRWDGEEMGKGEMKVTEIIPGQKIMWELGFEGFDQKMIVGMIFEPEGDDWVLTWTAEGELGYNPMYRYYGLMIDSDLGADYEKGLQQLKEFCELLPDYPGIEVTEVASVPALSVKDSVTIADIGAFFGTYYPMMYMYALRNEASIAGHLYAVYHNWDPEGKILIEAGMPLTVALDGEDMMMATMSPGGKVVKATHWGAYDKVGPAHDALHQYINVMKMEFAGAPWEVYVTDPMQEPDTLKWETIIYYPVK